MVHFHLHEDLKNLELVSEPEGQPFFRHYVEGVPSSLSLAVSISHTSLLAVAIVVQPL